MPSQIVPITDIASAGVIKDTPSVSLPPNVFSDMRNVRLHNNAINKMPGEMDRIEGLSGVSYVAFWPAPRGDKYIVILEKELRVYDGDWVEETNSSTRSGVDDGTNWQHTLFNGGYHLILNNGESRPVFLSDVDPYTVQPLPNWDSYAVEDIVREFEHDGSSDSITIVDENLVISGAALKFTIIPRNPSAAIVTETVTLGQTSATPDGSLTGIGTLDEIDTTTHTMRFTPDTGTGGATFRIAFVHSGTPTVTAGVIRSYGNLLVAGDLTETGNGGRRLPGLIRTSDVAAPGDIPQNWNPFALGANSADEIILASTGRIQDMAELQGVLYVYTDSSIHAFQQTGNPQVPFRTSPVTDNYGCDNTGGVLEFDGKHIVVGSNDVYIFAGHPGSISSIADGRVRDSFRSDLDFQITRFNKWDELWFWSSGEAVMYIWNYRDNTWSIRSQTAPINMVYNGSELVMSRSTSVYTTDDRFLNADGEMYESYIERKRLAMAPEFDTETLNSIALLYSGTADLSMRFEGSNVPSNEGNIESAPFIFDADTNWKTDVRVQGRFLNYRISDGESNNETWSLSGLQMDIGKGGTR